MHRDERFRSIQQCQQPSETSSFENIAREKSTINQSTSERCASDGLCDNFSGSNNFDKLIIRKIL
jgi:hypothetical protein